MRNEPGLPTRLTGPPTGTPASGSLPSAEGQVRGWSPLPRRSSCALYPGIHPVPAPGRAPARHPNGPSLRNTVLATTAALGAVATGTFTALVPHSEDGVATTAAADEAPVTAVLAAHTTPRRHRVARPRPGRRRRTAPGRRPERR